MVMGKAFRGGRFVAFFELRSALLGVLLLAALAMGLCLAQPAWADEDSSDETYEVTVTGTYHQSDAYSMLAMVNKFRTAEVDFDNGNTPWQKSQNGDKVPATTWYHYDDSGHKVKVDGLNELKWDSGLEEIAMQRAAEAALRIEATHTRPDGSSCFTCLSADGSSARAENLAANTEGATDTFETWREDDEGYERQGHRRNMLYATAAIGIACFELNGVEYWAMELGENSESQTALNCTIDKTVDICANPNVIFPFTISSISSAIKVSDNFLLPANAQGIINIEYSYDGNHDYRGAFQAALTDSWKIKSGSDVVKLDGSTVTGLKAGTAILSTTALGKEVTCTITVADKTIPSITNFDESKIVKLSDNLVFSPKCDSDAKPRFKSSNESVATVDGDGKVTLKKMGYADITVSYAETDDYEAASKTCKLTVVDDATNVPADGKGEVQIYVPGQNNANVTVTPAARVSNPAKTSISKLVKAKKAFTVKWKKKSGVAGYQVRYSLKSSMKGAKTVTVKSAKTTSKKVKKLKKKKKYYVQVRTYKVVNGKTYWSGWSAKKSVKTK